MSHGGNFRDFFLRPDRFIKEHPEEVATAAIIAATIYTGGAAGGLWGAGAGAAGAAGAGGLTAAEAGAGAAAAAGSGLTAADYAAVAGLGAAGAGGAAEVGAGLTAADYAGLAATDAGASGGLLGVDAGMGAGEYFGGAGAAEYGGLLGSGAQTAGAGSAMDIGAGLYGGELSSVGDIGGTMLGGAPPTSPTVLPGDWGGPLQVWEQIKGVNVNKGLKALNAAQQFSKLAQPAPAPRMAATRPATYQGGGGNELAALQALYANPAGQERLKQLLRQRGVSV